MHLLVPILVPVGVLAVIGAGLAYGYHRLDRFCARYAQKVDLDIAVLKFQRQHAYRELGVSLEEADLDGEELESLAFRIGRSFRLGLLGS